MKRKLFSFGETGSEKMASRWIFLIGLFSSTQIYVGGYTAISELFLVLLMPLNLAKNFRIFSKDRCSAFLWLLFLWMGGVIFTDFWTHNSIPAFIRGMIPPLGILSSLVCIYPLLKKNPDGLRWYFVGAALSGVISTFVFQHGSDIENAAVLTGEMTATESIIGSKLYWVARVNDFMGLPVKGWYLSTPLPVSIGLLFYMAVHALVTGGRSSFLVSFLSVAIVAMGRQSRIKMMWMKKNLPIVLLGLILFLSMAKFVYSKAATIGLMGEKELEKFEEQAKGRSAFETLMKSRGEFFIALFAIKDHPIIGHGSHAMDYNGYVINHIIKYGAEEDFERNLRLQNMRGIRTIPAHSHIMCYWLWAGIPGLLPWLYILCLLWKTLTKRMYVYPPYFGCLAILIPASFWHIFFSPLSSRIGMGVLVAMCFIVQTMEREQRRANGYMVKSW